MNLLWGSLISGILDQTLDTRPPDPDIPLRAASDTLRSLNTIQQFKIDYADKIDRLVLICRSMWELIRASNNLSEDDLLKKVMEVDLRDSTLDGKITIPPKKCSSCNRLMSKRHRRCIYCGAENLLDSAFDLLSE
jgi:hypothetical protein